MQHDDAKNELDRHAGIAEDFYDHGFTGCLRPYSGIRAENFHSVLELLLVVGEAMASKSTVDRGIVQSVFDMTATARRWGVDEDGMLVRNGLISPDDRLKLRRWIRIVEDMMLDLLAGREPHETIHAYCEYVAQFGWGTNAAFFVPLLGSAIDADDCGDQLQGYCAAIARMGSGASATAESLARARQRKWDWYEPHERCTSEMLGYIDQALAAIGSSGT